jgi:hypothetical protein
MRTVSTFFTAVLIASTCSAMKFFGKQSINEPLLEDTQAFSPQKQAQTAGMPPGVFHVGNVPYEIDFDTLNSKEECAHLRELYGKHHKARSHKVSVEIDDYDNNAAKAAVRFCQTGHFVFPENVELEVMKQLFDEWKMNQFLPLLDQSWKSLVSVRPKLNSFTMNIGTWLSDSAAGTYRSAYSIMITPGFTAEAQWPPSVFSNLKEFMKRVCQKQLVSVEGYPSGSTACTRTEDFAGGYYSMFREITLAVPGIEREYIGNYNGEKMAEGARYYKYFASFKIADAV